MLHRKYLYCWHDRRYDAVKVGVSSRPQVRVIDYSLACNLRPDWRSLRTFGLFDPFHAYKIERDLLDALRQIPLLNVKGLNELFALDFVTYDWAADFIIDFVARREIDLLGRAQHEARNAARARIADAEKQAALEAEWEEFPEDEPDEPPHEPPDTSIDLGPDEPDDY